MRIPRVLIADDHPLVLQALRRLVEPLARIVDTASDGDELLAKALALRPDHVVLDVCMPGMDGVEVARRIHAELPRLPLAFWTMVEPPPAADLAALQPAMWLSKNLPTAELATAFARWLGEREDAAGCRPTARQLQVLRLLAEGRAMKQVATRLGLSVRTVAFHKYRAMKLLGLESTADVVRYVLHDLPGEGTEAMTSGGDDEPLGQRAVGEAAEG
jgi:DNA-binding NarL/FixJ family response regulator